MEFIPFQKIARISRNVVVSEKIDGTNGQIIINEYGEMAAASRNRVITPQDDHYGFAKWVEANKNELLKLGPGHHFGEWWGYKIQRNYGLREKRFSLFNLERWADGGKRVRPACCHVVPILWEGNFDDLCIRDIMDKLRKGGSVAAPGFMQPEGIVIYHCGAKAYIGKKTFENDEEPKSRSRAA